MRTLRALALIFVVVAVICAASRGAEGFWGKTEAPKDAATPKDAVAPPAQPFAVPYFAPPQILNLCGEVVPLENMDVFERFDRAFTLIVYNHAQVYLWLKRAERFFPLIEQQLKAAGLPDDLKYVVVAESDLLVGVASSAGAAGAWQFIKGTGKRYGLDQNAHVDERYDFELATDSALSYLRDLYRIFNNWTLAIAAYNCGEGRVLDEAKKQTVSSYYFLKLPRETENYVFRILAIKAVLGNPRAYGYYLPPGAGYPEVRLDRVQLSLPRSVALQCVADAAGMTYRDFKLYNPTLRSNVIPAGAVTVKVPEGRGKMLEAGLPDALAAAPPAPVAAAPATIVHKVQKGETLAKIAGKYGVNQEDIRTWNKMKGKQGVKPGQSLKIMK